MEALPPLDTMSLIHRIERLEQEKRENGEKAFALMSRVLRLLEDGLTTDGAHHKQWYLWRIADALGLSQLMEVDADKGIAP